MSGVWGNGRQSGARSNLRAKLTLAASAAALAAGLSVTPAQAIIVRDDVGLANSVDASNSYPAVVQLFELDNTGLFGGGAGGLYYNCTGTLINPRTILTAAHCVRDEGSEDFGQPFAGQDLTNLIGFGVDTRPRLLNFAHTGADYYHGGMAWSTDVIIHPSAEPSHGNQPFPWADTALIALNEPIADVNPMGMLLSPLTSLTHVVQIGYGTYGTGETGQQGIGTKRLMGENMLGMLGSDSTFLDGIFPADGSYTDYGFETQVEYYTDFDRPNRPSANAGCTFTGNDINCDSADSVKNIDFFDGNALPHEVTTAPGDSGGPLIADQLGGPPLVIADLSGGWTFFGTPSDQYGGNGTSFYQPLFSVWQFLVENNPYKYVGAKAGNGAWEDPSHWVQLQDPNIFILDANGKPVVGTPSGSECGVYQTGPTVGTILGVPASSYNETANSPYYFPPEGGTCATAKAGSGGGTPASVPAGGVATTAAVANANSATMTSGVSTDKVTDGNGNQVYAVQQAILAGTQKNNLFTAIVNRPTSYAAPTYPAGATDPKDYGNNLPQSSTLLGPGSTNFVPENTDGAVGTAYQNPAQYFDVTLSQDGTTTLSTYYFEIDRLTMQGNAGLDITAAGGLLTNIDVEVYDNAHLNVDGVLGAPDIIADGGVVSGNGTLILGTGLVPSATQALVIGNGAVTPGAIGGVGHLTVLGNVGISAGGLFAVDVGNTKASATDIDYLDIYGNFVMNGTVAFNSTVTPFYHQGGTFAAANAIQVGDISVPDTLAGVLYPVVALHHLSGYDTLSVQLEAADFSTVFNARNENESAIGNILDANRTGSYNALSAIYGPVDTMSDGNLADAFDQLSPNQQSGFTSAGRAGLNLLSGTIAQRLADIRTAHANGQSGTGMAFNGADQITMAMSANSDPNSPLMQSALGRSFGQQSLLPAATASNSPAAVSPAQGEERKWGGFLTATSLDGSAHYGTQDKDITGYLVAAGLDTMVTDDLVLGAAFSMGEAKADLPYATGNSKLKTYQGTVYGSWSADDVFVDGYAGWGGVDASSNRIAVIGGTAYGAHADPSGSQGVVAMRLGTVIQANEWLRVMPIGGLEWDAFHTDAYTETGSVIAMHVNADDANQLLVRVGAEAVGDYQMDDAMLHPHVQAFWVGALDHSDPHYTAAFAAAPGGTGSFVYNSDTSWLEFGVGLDATVSDMVQVGIGYDATVSRKEASYGAVTGRIRIRF